MRTEVLVAGAGPTGLFLAGLLARRGVDVVVLEQRSRPAEHSRAIGLHPPALHALDRLDLAGAAVAAGVRVSRGVGYGAGSGPRSRLGELSLAGADRTYPFVLTLPQACTEALLAERVERLAPGAVRRGVAVTGIEDPGAGGGPVRVTARVTARPAGGGSGAGQRTTGATATGQQAMRQQATGQRAAGPAGDQAWEADVVIGADGTRSRVRELAGVGVRDRDWGDCYLMGDFDDPGVRTGVGDPAAHIHLHHEGVVERFPLPGGRWRWVVHTGRTLVPERAGELTDRARERLGFAPDPASATMLSAFTVQRRLARHMVRGRTVLAGDAAHGISPIGGQGMTLGWMDALALAPLLEDLVRGGGGRGVGSAAATGRPGTGPDAGLERHPGFARYDRDRRRAALRAARQAEANMLLGRPLPGLAYRLRDATARAALAGGAGSALARLYTMGWAG